MMFDLGEIDRKLACLVRFGTVIELDAANARVRCSVGGLETDWLPWCAGRAGSTRNWSAPRGGEQVVVFAPYGDTTQGFVLPGFYQDAHPAPANSQDKDTIVFPDGTTFEHDSASNTYTQTIQGSGNWIINCKHATINADDATLNAKDTFVKGNMTVDGLLTYKNGIAGKGGSNGNAIQGNINITGGDVNADGIGLKSHHHTAQGANAQTTAAQP